MIKFWHSLQLLADEGLKLLWFGIGITTLGLCLPDLKWLSWFGLGATVVGAVLRHRTEKLKKIHVAPRKLKEEDIKIIRSELEKIPKQPIAVGFFGQDHEAQQYATQIKQLLEASGLLVVRLEGFLALRPSYGLSITVFNSDANNPCALGIKNAFDAAGIKLEFHSNPNKMDPSISLSVYGKPPQT